MYLLCELREFFIFGLELLSTNYLTSSLITVLTLIYWMVCCRNVDRL